jgi:cytochrome P450
MSAVKEPRASDFDLTSPTFKRDPFPTLARMRELGPLICVRIPFFGRVWMATAYAAVNDLLGDHNRFVQSPATAGNDMCLGATLARVATAIAHERLFTRFPGLEIKLLTRSTASRPASARGRFST